MVNLMQLGKDAKAIGVVAIVIAVVLAVIQTFQTTGIITGVANDTITKFITALGYYGDWIGIIVIAVLGFFILKFMTEN